MSCNGCRVLRKGCSESCSLRPCLQWIESPEAQGHATVFVAKFFGRAGLMEFIGGVPESERTALFQSLLYEACGRTVNPVFGAVGLLWSGNWHVCQEAVETVLRGGTLARPPSTHVPIGSNPGLPNVGNLEPPIIRLARPNSGGNKNIGSADFSLKVAAKPAASFKRQYCTTDQLAHAAAVEQSAKRRAAAGEYSVCRPCHVADSSASWDLPAASLHVRRQQQAGPCGGASSSAAAVRASSAVARAASSGLALQPLTRDPSPVVLSDASATHLMMMGAAAERRSLKNIGLPHVVSGSIHAASDQTRNIQLDLTLSCPPHHLSSSASHLKSSGGPARVPASPTRVSSPNSTLSLNSEGSVTTLDSPTSDSRGYKLLDLLY